MELCLCSPTQIRIVDLQSSQQIGKEADRVIFLWTKREPGSWQCTLGQPISEQGGFAEAGWGRKEYEGSLEAFLEAANEARAMQKLGRLARDVEFRSQQEVIRQIGACRKRDLAFAQVPGKRGPLSPCVWRGRQ